MQHVPVLLNQVVDALAIQADHTLIDGTYGRGGHAKALLDCLGNQGRLLVVDQDPEAIAHAKAGIGQDTRVVVRQANFSELGSIVEGLGWSGQINGILLDLGVSSPQLDQSERGFSFMADGPLDMRMNTDAGQSAAEWLADVDESTLATVIKEYGEERHARRIAQAIVKARAQTPVETTGQLADVVLTVSRGRPGHHPATRTFQAIRIFINRELEVLDQWLSDFFKHLAPGGRMAVISFHSLEDRRVKKAWNALAKPPAASRRDPLALDFKPTLELVGKPISADETECHANPRSRSARLRVAERLMAEAA